MPVISHRITVYGNVTPRLFCGTARVREEWKGTAVVPLGCGRMNCIRKEDWCFPQHADGRFVYDIVDQSGDPIDISGARIQWIIAESVTGAILLAKDTDDGSMAKVTTTRVQWDIDSTESAALPARNLYHEMMITTTLGENRFPFAGRFRVEDTRIADA